MSTIYLILKNKKLKKKHPTPCLKQTFEPSMIIHGSKMIGLGIHHTPLLAHYHRCIAAGNDQVFGQTFEFIMEQGRMK